MTEPEPTEASPEPTHAPHGQASAASAKGPGFFSGAGDHLRRALRVDLTPGKLLIDEAAIVDALPGRDEGIFGRLLLWRRSMLFLGFCVLVPSLVVDVIRTILWIDSPDFGGLPHDKDAVGLASGFEFLAVCVNVAFAFGVLAAYRRWDDWARSRKVLLTLWLIAFLTPFALALFPYRALGGGSAQVAAIYGLAGALMQTLQLAPKVLALIPGLLRAAVGAKTLFPSAGAPGWLILLAAPLYLLILYIVLQMPYQLSGSPLVVLAMICFILAPLALWRSARAMTRPMVGGEVVAVVSRTRRFSVGLNGLGVVFLIAAVASAEVGFDLFDILRLALAMAANILILSVVVMDTLVQGMMRAWEDANADRDDARADAMADFVAEVTLMAPASLPSPQQHDPR